MKYLLVISFLVLSCNSTETQNTQAQPEAAAEPCICTKEFRPVCGENGQTYSNPCQAECANTKVAKEGAC